MFISPQKIIQSHSLQYKFSNRIAMRKNPAKHNNLLNNAVNKI